MDRSDHGRWLRLRAALVLLWALAFACSGSTLAPHAVAMEIPRVEDLSAFDADVRRLIENGASAAAADPDSAMKRAGLAMIYHANELFEQARLGYQQALSIDPDNPRWIYHLAIVEERLNDVDGAIATMGRSIALEPAYPASYWRRGGWLIDTARPEDAETDFRTALELAPQDPAGATGLARALLAQQRAQEAVDLLEPFADSLDDSLMHLLLGNAYRALGKLDLAESHLKQSQGDDLIREDAWTAADILRFKLSFGSQIQMAVSLIGTGSVDRGIEVLERWRPQQPNDARLLRQLGRAYLMAGRQDDGLATLEEGVRLHPDDYKMLSEAASGYHVTGDSPRALQLLDHATEIKPDAGLAHARRGVVLQSLKRYGEAAESYRKAILFRPRDTGLMRRFGDCFALVGRFEEAAAAYQHALTVDEKDALSLSRLGFMLHRLGRYPGAETALRRALAIEPEHPEWTQLLEEVVRVRQAREASKG